MNKNFAAAIRRAVGLTRASDVMAATRVIQDALSGQGASGATEIASQNGDDAPAGAGPKEILMLRSVNPANGGADGELSASSKATGASGAGEFQTPRRMRRPLRDVLRVLRADRVNTAALGGLPGMRVGGAKGVAPPPMPEGARFLPRYFTCAAGARSYKLYIPASAPDRPRGLVIMLHGCKQDPDDFAAGTSMNGVAERNGMMVAYPGQTNAANASSCWNWFNPAHQERASGEPAIIAGITREIVAEFGIDPRQVFVAGLSAGGAMAAVMGETYPELYSAVGVHSGLAYRSANDVVSAFAAMRGDSSHAARAPRGAAKDASRGARVIVFQGSADQTVHPSNGERIVVAAGASDWVRREVRGSKGGRSFARTIIEFPDGAPVAEHWLIDGAVHAWSGGHPAGSYTDPKGPDASAEMMRFFLNGQAAPRDCARLS